MFVFEFSEQWIPIVVVPVTEALTEYLFELFFVAVLLKKLVPPADMKAAG